MKDRRFISFIVTTDLFDTKEQFDIILERINYVKRELGENEFTLLLLKTINTEYERLIHTNPTISVIPTIKIMNKRFLSLLIRYEIPFKTSFFKYEGKTGLDEANLLIDNFTKKVLLFDSEGSPLTDYYVVGMCDLEDYNFYMRTATYPPHKTMDELFNETHFDTYNEQLVYVTNYITKMEKEIKEIGK